MLLIGLDLAWGQKATSGICALKCGQNGYGELLAYENALTDDDAIVQWIQDWDAREGQEGIFIGIDAPLLVPNWTGERPCESELRRQFARFHAGAHPANRRLFHDDVRGERLVKRFAEFEIAHDPYFTQPRKIHIRHVIEVFPHPAHIVLFGLNKTLKYKAKKGRDAQSRGEAFRVYAQHLRNLATQTPSLVLSQDWPLESVGELKGSALKRYEDGLDALSCAYIVLWMWWYGSTGQNIIGDLVTGYIAIPKIAAILGQSGDDEYCPQDRVERL